MLDEFDAFSPPFIYGTAWKEERTRKLTELAVESGFRAIDTANQRKHYHEAGVGAALEALFGADVVERDELFVQSKFTHVAAQGDRLPYDPDADIDTQVEQSFESSLEHLGLERLDAYLLHGPSTRSGLAEIDRRVWRRMEALHEEDRVGAIGVSNFAPNQLQELLDWADRRPAFVQNRCFARAGWDRPVREICDAHDIDYQGFSLLTANARELRSDPLVDIAERHDKTLPQIVFRFAVAVGIIPLTGTTSEEHMRQDLACFDFELDGSEIETIETIAG